MKGFIFLCYLITSIAYCNDFAAIDGAKILSNQSVLRKIKALETYSFHSLETDQLAYELKVRNLKGNGRAEFLCLYIIPIDRYIDQIPDELLPLYFKDFESCE